MNTSQRRTGDKRGMNRKETTEFLSKLLITDRLTGMGKYYSKEVSIDYGTTKGKRVDFVQFEPAGVTSIGDIEKGRFICYEIKSCKADVYSGNGLNFFGEKNYIVTTMQCWREIQPDLRSGKFYRHLKECCPEASGNFGVIAAVPWGTDAEDEFENPVELTKDIAWQLKIVLPCHEGRRTRSMTELLFYMVRSGKM